METPVHPFEHLGKPYKLTMRGTGPNASWNLIVRWGPKEASGHRAKIYNCFKSKETGRPLDLKDALKAAKHLIEEHFKQPDQFAKLRDGTKLRGATTVVNIVDQWVAAGYPEANGRKRPAQEANRHAILLKFSREFFATIAVSAVNPPLMVKYSKWRPSKSARRPAPPCLRTTDLELNTLCQCFHWAVGTGLADTNPFEKRPRFQDSEDIVHASDPTKMPASDEELHSIVGYLFKTADKWNIVAGAQLMYQALTGQRSGEPGFLRWSARDTDSGDRPPGARFTRPMEGIAGQLQEIECLGVKRLKKGINPSVIIRPALASFLAAWEPYCRRTWPDSDFWFPHPEDKNAPLVAPSDESDPLSGRLRKPAEALGLPKRTAHSMRAFYVRVRRGQGATDALIADELGQKSGAAMIVDIYGDDKTIRGDRRWDWLPSPESGVPIAWTLLGAGAQGNIVRL